MAADGREVPRRTRPAASRLRPKTVVEACPTRSATTLDEVSQVATAEAISRRLSARNAVRLYEFTDVVELLVVVELRRRFTPQHVRKVIEHLRSRGYKRPLIELRFAVEGSSQVFFSILTARGKATVGPTRRC